MINWRGNAVSVNRRLIPVLKNGKPDVILSREYLEFRGSIENKCYGEKRISGFINLNIELVISFGRDTDNYIKGICDALKNAQIIDDDKYVKDIFISRTFRRNDGSLDEIRIEILKADGIKI